MYITTVKVRWYDIIAIFEKYYNFHLLARTDLNNLCQNFDFQSNNV